MEDRISAVPDEILSRILSLLTFKEAVATSILCRRWRFLWTLTPSLSFGNKQVFQPIMDQRKFINMVNQVLRVCKDSNLHEFIIHCPLDDCSSCHIDLWIAFAFAKCVSRLELDFDILACSNEKNYSIPSELFDVKKGIKCHLQLDSVSAVFASPLTAKNSLKPLKELILTRVDITDELFEMILSTCSPLECLLLCRSEKLINAKHTGPHLRLKCLEMYLCSALENLEIFAPNLVVFRYQGLRINISIREAKDLVDVCIVPFSGVFANPKTSYLGMTYPDRFCFIFGQFATYLPQLVLLTMDFQTFEARLSDEVPHFPKLKQLIFHDNCFSSTRLSYLAVTSVVRASPLLQRVELHIDSLAYSRETYFKQTLKRVPMSPHQNLRELLLSGFIGHESHMDLIVSIFDYATALEKVEIRTSTMIWLGKIPCFHKKRDDVDTKDCALQLSQILPPNAQLKFIDT